MLALRIILILLVLFFGKVGKALVNTPDATEQVNKFSCCAFRNNFSNSIVEVLTNMTSNGVTEITTDAVLPSLVILEGLENIVVVGLSNVSIHCNSVGAVKFISCRNVTIKGINWLGCGSKNEPGIEFRNSSNITIQNCSFHNSTRQTIVLSEVSKNININSCEFIHNRRYDEGHGTAINFSSHNHAQLHFVIDSCNLILFQWSC